MFLLGGLFVVVNVAIVHNKVYWVWFVYVLEWTGLALLLFLFLFFFVFSYSPQQTLLGLVLCMFLSGCFIVAIVHNKVYCAWFVYVPQWTLFILL